MQVLTEIDRERISALRTRDEFFWLDLRAPDDTAIDVVGELLGLHPLALEDTREFGQRPKSDAYEDHVLVVFYTATARPPDAQGVAVVDLVEVHVYISGGFVLTIARQPCTPLDRIRELLIPTNADEPEEYLVYRILDALTDGYQPVVDGLRVRKDALERQVVEQPRHEQTGRIFRLKQDVAIVQRQIAAQRDGFDETQKEILEVPGLTHSSRPYLRDVKDHLIGIAGELDGFAGDLTSLTDTFFASNANRLATLATRVTVGSVFFLTATLVTSFFGQNFKHLTDSIDSKTDFLVYGVGGLFVPLLILAVVAYIKREDWL